MMGIIIAFPIRTISYRYWMIFSRISYVSTLLSKYLSWVIYTILATVSFFHSIKAPNSPHRYNPGFGAAREWKNDAVAIIVDMI